MYNYLKNQQGSVTAISLIAVTFFIIVLAGSMIYSQNEVNNTTKARDLSQAQFLAEAGIKRAINNFNLNEHGVWSWVDNITVPTNWQTATTYPAEQFHVKISLASDTTNQAIVPSTPPANTTYLVTATGRCNGIQKTMSALVSVNLGGSNGNSPMFNYGIFSSGNITLFGNDDINADFGANGSWSDTTAKVNGDYTITSTSATNTTKWKQLDKTISWPFVDFSQAASTYNNPNRPILTKTDSSGNTIVVNNMTDMLAASKSTQTLEGRTIIIDGNLYIDDNAMKGLKSLQLKNVNIFVNGEFGINTTKQINVTSDCLIVAKDRIFLHGNNIGGAMYVGYSDIQIFDSTNLDNGAFYAKNNITIANSTIKQSLKAVTNNGFSAGSGTATGVNVSNWTIYS